MFHILWPRPLLCIPPSCPLFSSITSFTFSRLLFHVSLPFNCVCRVSLTNFLPHPPLSHLSFHPLLIKSLSFCLNLPFCSSSLCLSFFLSIPPFPHPSPLPPAGCGLSFCGGGFLPQCVGGSGLYHCFERVDCAGCRGDRAASHRWRSQSLQAGHRCSGMSDTQTLTLWKRDSIFCISLFQRFFKATVLFFIATIFNQTGGKNWICFLSVVFRWCPMWPLFSTSSTPFSPPSDGRGPNDLICHWSKPGMIFFHCSIHFHQPKCQYIKWLNEWKTNRLSINVTYKLDWLARYTCTLLTRKLTLNCSDRCEWKLKCVCQNKHGGWV